MFQHTRPGITCLAFCLAACSSSTSNSNGNGNGDTKTGASIRTSLQRTDAANALTAVAAGARGVDLASLQYFITSIQICEDMVLQGSGFNNAQGCVELYAGPHDATLNNPSGGDPSVHDYVGQAAAARTTTAGYIDLVDASSRAGLTTDTALTSANAGGYQYGLVGWAYPIKVKATLDDADGNPTLYTHDGTVSVENGGPVLRSTTPFTTGPADLAIVPLPNGGSWFKFQHPFTISAEDISSGSTYALDLTFNPDGIVRGFLGGANGNVYDVPYGTQGGNNLLVPLLDLTPVPHKAGEVTVKETYVGSITTGTSDRLDVRIELYSLKDDATHTIYGASTTPLINGSTSRFFLGFGKVAFVDTHSDGSVDFQDWDQKPFVSNFVRQDTVGGTTTADLACSMSGSTTPVFADCTAATFPVTFALTARTDLP